MEVSNCPKSDPQLATKKPQRPSNPNMAASPQPEKTSGDGIEGSKQNVGDGSTPIGRKVTGVVDGMFDMGYLISVQMGESDTIYPGVVFGPGLISPFSKANDIAPNVGQTVRKLDVKGHITM